MKKRDNVFKIAIIALAVAIVIAGILIALRFSGLQEAVDPLQNTITDNESFEVDPNNLPEGAQIIYDSEPSDSSNATSGNTLNKNTENQNTRSDPTSNA